MLAYERNREECLDGQELLCIHAGEWPANPALSWHHAISCVGLSESCRRTGRRSNPSITWVDMREKRNVAQR